MTLLLLLLLQKLPLQPGATLPHGPRQLSKYEAKTLRQTFTSTA